MSRMRLGVWGVVLGAVVMLAACGGGSAQVEPPLPAPLGKYIAFIGPADPGSSQQVLYVVDSGAPGSIHTLSAPLKRMESVDRFVVSPDGQQVAYITYRSDRNREEIRFTGPATPGAARRVFVYDDQGVADLQFTADSLGYVALVAHRGATPPVQLPAGMAFFGKPDNDASVYVLDWNGTNLDINYRFALDPNGAAVFLDQGGITRKVTLSPFGNPPAFATTLPGFFAGNWGMRVTNDGSYLLGNAASLYGVPTNGSTPAVVLRDGYLPNQPVGEFGADDDASHIAFIEGDSSYTLRQTSRATPGVSSIVALPDPAYVRFTVGSQFLPGTLTFLVALADPANAQPNGLYLFDATGTNPPLRLSASGSESVNQLLVVDADTVVYSAYDVGAAGSVVRQIELTAPGAPLDLLTARNSPIGPLTVCGSVVAFGAQGVPYGGVWAARLGQAGSATLVVPVMNGVAYSACLP